MIIIILIIYHWIRYCNTAFDQVFDTQFPFPAIHHDHGHQKRPGGLKKI